jgi:hypothetical protein
VDSGLSEYDSKVEDIQGYPGGYPRYILNYPQLSSLVISNSLSSLLKVRDMSKTHPATYELQLIAITLIFSARPICTFLPFFLLYSDQAQYVLLTGISVLIFLLRRFRSRSEYRPPLFR